MITKEYKNYKESQKNHTPISRADWWFAMALCAAVIATWTLEQLVRNQPANAGAFAPVWLPLAASMFAAAGIIRLDGSPRWIRVQRALLWSGLLLMVWVANGLLFDLFAMAGLIGDPATGLRIGVNWPGMATRTFALAVAVFLAVSLARRSPGHPLSYLRYAFVCTALPVSDWWRWEEHQAPSPFLQAMA
jgi:hypothetical protein